MDQVEHFILQVVASALVSGGVASSIVWLTKLWISERIKAAIQAEYAEKLETHKAQLKAQSEVEIERLRSKLRDASLEHQIRFTRLHDTRATVISETYSCLRELYLCLKDYVKSLEVPGEPTKEERYNKLVEAHKDFFGSYYKRRIFFPQETATKLDEINGNMVRTGTEFRLRVESGNTQDSAKRWFEIEQRVGTEIEKALVELEKEFRFLLGDDEPDSSNTTGSASTSHAERQGHDHLDEDI